MPLVFSPEHIAFREAVRSFMTDKSPEAEVRRLMETQEGFDPVVWSQLNDQLGAAALAIPEEYGGAGFGVEELGIVLEEAGRSLLCAPLLSSVLASYTILATGNTAAAHDLLPGIAAGATLATVALAADGTGSSGSETIVAEPGADGESWILSGSVGYVLDGHIAEVLLVPATAPDGTAMFVVRGEADGMSRTVLPTLDQTRRLARLEFSRTPAELLIGAQSAPVVIGHARRLASTLLASEQAGVAEATKDMAVEYAKDRIQFGQTIGSFQAIKHKCADLHVAVESSKSAAYAAATAMVERPADVAEIVAVAASFCSEASLTAATENILIHGGIGFTWEHPAHLYYKRAKAAEFLFGDVVHHREVLAAEIGL